MLRAFSQVFYNFDHRQKADHDQDRRSAEIAE